MGEKMVGFEERIESIKRKLKTYLDEFEKLKQAATSTLNFIECIDLNGGYEDGRIKVKRTEMNTLYVEIEGKPVMKAYQILNFKKLVEYRDELKRICHVLEKMNKQIQEARNLLTWANSLYVADMKKEYNEIVDEVLKLFEEPEYLE